MNNICLIGRLTKEPELKRTQSGKDVASFTLAVDRMGDGTDFIRCIAWEKTAEFVMRNFLKGQRMGLQGRLKVDVSDDKTYTTVVAERVFFADGIKTKAEPKAEFVEMDEVDGELPF